MYEIWTIHFTPAALVAIGAGAVTGLVLVMAFIRATEGAEGFASWIRSRRAAALSGYVSSFLSIGLLLQVLSVPLPETAQEAAPVTNESEPVSIRTGTADPGPVIADFPGLQEMMNELQQDPDWAASRRELEAAMAAAELPPHGRLTIQARFLIEQLVACRDLEWMKDRANHWALIDPWGKDLMLGVQPADEQGRRWAQVQSAGPDGQYGTEDDLYNAQALDPGEPGSDTRAITRTLFKLRVLLRHQTKNY